MSYVNVISRWQIMHFFNFVDFRNSCKLQQCSNFTYVISQPKHCRQVTQKRIRILQSKITSFSYVHKQYIIIMHHISECDLQDAITYLTCCISHVTMLFNLYDKNTQWFKMDVKREITITRNCPLCIILLSSIWKCIPHYNSILQK